MSPGAIGGAAASSDISNKKRKLLDDSDSDSDDGGATIQSDGFKVNQDFARRFEHNKKREEKHRLEEKFKKEGRQEDEEDDESSNDETEDEQGFLATEDLDAQISATLTALRNKDPRVYNKDVTFYKADEDVPGAAAKDKKEKPVFLRDYQREKILRGDVGASDDEDDTPQTYAQEQDALKKSIVSEINAAGEDSPETDDDSGDDFIQKKKGKEVEDLDVNGLHPSRSQAIKVSDVDVANANRDPETFLSNFMAARAWVPTDVPKWEAFESDDDEDDGEADEWEQAYNMRFEDPEKSNEVLRSYARDIANARSVRREDKSGRKRQRELEKERKEDERRQRKEEKSRLRKLKLDEAEEKLKKIKQAAGNLGRELSNRDWVTFLDEAWEDEAWEEEMQRRFGADYYAMQDQDFNSGDGDDGEDKQKKNPKKPKWDDDIDIKDIIPDFEDENAKPDISLTDEEEGDDGAHGEDGEEDGGESSSKARKTSRDHKRQRLESQKQARRDRAKLEALVDSKLALTDPDVLAANPPGPSGFRYRETSPQTFGMTARDILLAPSDKALNEFAGLKKLAAFRDEEKKRRDRKKLGKKARLRQWRREQFGHEFEKTGPTYGFEKYAPAEGAAAAAEEEGGRTMDVDDDEAGNGNVKGDVGERRKKRKRSKSKKTAPVGEAA